MFYFCDFPLLRHFCHRYSSVATRLGLSRAGVNGCHSRTRAPCLGRWQALHCSFLFLNYYCFLFTIIHLHVSYLWRCLPPYFIQCFTSTPCGGFSTRMPFLRADYTSHNSEHLWPVYNCVSINVKY